MARELAAGYRRIKIKIKPGWDLRPVETVRARFGDIPLMVDANAAYTLADATRRADRCCNMHFFHPVLVMDVCEVVKGSHTSAETAQRAVEWCRRIGRTPVLIEKEIDGFVVNRVLGAASREAFTLLHDGVASVEDIDAAVRNGLNWPMGPFELADFSGLDTVLRVRRDRFQQSAQPGDRATVEILERLVGDGRLGRKSGRGFYDYSTTPPTPLPLPA